MKIFLLLLLFPTLVYSTTYECKVSRKVGPENIVSESEIKKWNFSIKIYDTTKPELERCSYSTGVNKVTCDKHLVDKVETDNYVNIKKFYNFRSQFDVQLFSDMSFIENNGRGGVSYGKCEKL